MHTWPFWAFPILMLFTFPFTLFTIGVMSGWRGAVAMFGVDRLPDGVTFIGQSASFSVLGNYNGCLKVVVNADGFGVVPIFVFRAFHQPLFFPWGAVTSCENRKSFLATRLEVVIANGPTIGLTGASTGKIAVAWRAAHPAK